MAEITVEGTTFALTLEKKPLLWDGYSAVLRIAVKNEFINYENKCRCSLEDVELIYFVLRRLVAGGYRKHVLMRLEGANLALDVDPHVDEGMELTREYLRAQPYTATFSLLLYSHAVANTLGGVFTFILNRDHVTPFADELQKELEPYQETISKRNGKYMFVGVSPQGYKGCNYWYFDPTKMTKPNTFVWVKMGRSKLEQLVYVDCVRYFRVEEVPYDIDRCSRVLKQATPQDIVEAKKIWKD